MTFTRVSHPFPVRGVTQRPDETSQLTSVKDLENSWISPVKGLVKRPGTEYLTEVQGNPLTSARVHAVERADGGYVLLASHQLIRGFLTDGTSLLLHNRTGTSLAESDLPAWTLSSMEPALIEDADGGFNAFRPTTSDTMEDIISPTAGTRTYTFRIWIKAVDDSPTALSIVFTDGTNSVTGTYNLSTETASGGTGGGGNVTGLGAGITKQAGGWYDCRLRFQYTSPGGTPKIQITQATDLYYYNPELFDLAFAQSGSVGYLDIMPQAPLIDPEFLTGWTVDANASLNLSTDLGPFGFSNWTEFSSVAGASAGGKLALLNDLAFNPGLYRVSVYFRRNSATPADSFKVSLIKPGSPADVSGEITIDTNTAKITASVNTVVHGVRDIGNSAYHAWFVVDGIDHPNIATGDALDVLFQVVDFGASKKTVDIWGAVLEPNARPEEPEEIVVPQRDIRMVSVFDTTFVASRKVQPELKTTLTPDLPFDTQALIFVRQASFDTDYRIAVKLTNGTEASAFLHTTDGTSSAPAQDVYEFEVINTPSTGGNVTISIGGFNGTFTSLVGSSKAFLRYQVLQTIQDIITTNRVTLDHQVASAVGETKVQVRGTDGTTYTATIVSDPESLLSLTQIQQVTNAPFAAVSSADIAAELARQLDDQLSSNFFTVVTKESVIYIKAGTSFIENIEVGDAGGDQDMLLLWKSVSFLEDLPLIGKHGFKIKVDGNTDEAQDDYYVEFEAENTVDDLAQGVWRETVGPQIPFEIDASTMPHQVRLQEDDAAGTITGVPHQRYLEFKEVAWADRQAGDEETNRAPQIFREPIKDLVIHNNRFGFVTPVGIIFGETGTFSPVNLWRSSVRSLVPTERIDVTTGGAFSSQLESALVLHNRLFLFGRRLVFEYSGPSPQTATTEVVLEIRNDPGIAPVTHGSTVAFASSKFGFVSVWELIPDRFTQRMDVRDSTVQVPFYLEGRAYQLISNSATGILGLISRQSGVRNRLYMARTFSSQDEAIRAWSKWSFIRDILGAAFIDRDLYLFAEEAGKVYLEKVRIGDAALDPEAGVPISLDNQFTESHPDIVSISSQSITLPTVPSGKWELFDTATKTVLSETGPGFRNLFSATEDFDTGKWTRANGTITPNAGTDPLGGSTASLFVGTSGQVQAGQAPPINSGETVTVSCYFRKNNSGLFAVLVSGGSSSSIDLDALTATNGKLYDSGNGWYRFVWTFTSPSSAPLITFAGTDGFVWGAQIEKGSLATVYERIRGYFDSSNNIVMKNVGDISTLSFVLGRAYQMIAEPHQPVLRDRNGGPVETSRNQIMRLGLNTTAKTSDYAIAVYRQSVLRSFTQLGQSREAGVTQKDGPDTQVKVLNDTPNPGQLAGFEWLVNVRPLGV